MITNNVNNCLTVGLQRVILVRSAANDVLSRSLECMRECLQLYLLRLIHVPFAWWE